MLNKITQVPVLAFFLAASIMFLAFVFAYDSALLANNTGWFSLPLAASGRLKAFLSILILNVAVFIFYRFSRNYKLIETKSSATFIFSGIGAVLLAPAFQFPLISFAALLSAVMLALMVKINTQKSIDGLVMLGSIIVSIGSLVNLAFAGYFILILISLSVLRTFRFKTFLISLVGFCLPYFYFFGLAYLFDFQTQFSLPETFIIPDLFLIFNLKTICILAFLLIAIWSAGSTLFNTQKLVVQQRNQITLISIYLLLSIILGLLTTLHYFAIPIVAAIGIYFGIAYQTLSKKWIVDLMLAIILIVSISSYFINF